MIRKEQIEHPVIMGIISGKRDRRRQQEKILDGLANWVGKKVNHRNDKQS
jgi:hypothetical protein